MFYQEHIIYLHSGIHSSTLYVTVRASAIVFCERRVTLRLCRSLSENLDCLKIKVTSFRTLKFQWKAIKVQIKLIVTTWIWFKFCVSLYDDNHCQSQSKIVTLRNLGGTFRKSLARWSLSQRLTSLALARLQTWRHQCPEGIYTSIQYFQVLWEYKCKQYVYNS